MDTPLTKAELIDVMNTYVTPLYHLIGGILALITIAFALWLIIWPFIRRRM